MRLRLTYFLSISGLLSLGSTLVVIVLMANFMNNSATSDREKAYTTATTVTASGVNAITNDLGRMRMYSKETLALVAPRFWRTLTSQQALSDWNQTLFDQWAPRVITPGETYGFGINFAFPNGAVNGTTQYVLQGIQMYTDVLRGGATQSTFTWSDPVTTLNRFVAFQYNNVSGPLLDDSTAYDYQLVVSYIVSLFGVEDSYDLPYAWAASDGNPYWYFAHNMALTNAHDVHIVVQTYQSSLGWASLMKDALRVGVAEDLYILGADGTVVTSTSSRVQAFITACAGNHTTYDDVTIACAGLPFASFPGLSRAASVVNGWRDGGLVTGITEVIDDSGTNKIVFMRPLFNKDGLQLIIVYIGDRPTPDQSTRIAFSVMMALTLVSVIVNFVGLGALLQPLRRAGSDMRRLADLDFTNFADSSAESAVAEANDVLQSTNTLVVALESFTRYVSIDLVRHLLHSNEIAAVGTRATHLVVMFADIVGFTELCSALSVDEVMTHLLARFFDVCTTAVLSTGGTVDKFIGDCVMAFYGAPSGHVSPSTAALCAAMHIFEGLLHPELDKLRGLKIGDGRQRKLRLLGDVSDTGSQASGTYKSSRSSHYSAVQAFNGVVKTRIGLNAGIAHVGNVGCEQRLSYTALGDTVNVASRTEALNKQISRNGCGILASDAVMEQAHPAIVRRFVGPAYLIGKSSPIDMYSIIGIDSTQITGNATPAHVVVDKNAPQNATFNDADAMRNITGLLPHLALPAEEAERAKLYSTAIAQIIERNGVEDAVESLQRAHELSIGQPRIEAIDAIAAAGRIVQESK